VSTPDVEGPAVEAGDDEDESVVVSAAATPDGPISEKPSNAAPRPADAAPIFNHCLTGKLSERRACRDVRCGR
jgi:hypothetical protein